MRNILASTVLVTFAVSAIAADTPEKVVNAYHAAIAATNYTAAAGMIRSSDLGKMKDSIVSTLRSAGTNEPAPLVRVFVRDNTVDEIAKLEPVEIFARILSWGASVQPMWVANLHRTKVVAIGSVIDPDDPAKAHVVCRQTTTISSSFAPATNTVLMTVVPVFKEGDGWRMQTPRDVHMMSGQLTGSAPARAFPRQQPGKPMGSGFSPMMGHGPAGGGTPPAGPHAAPAAPASPAAPAVQPAPAPRSTKRSRREPSHLVC